MELEVQAVWDSTAGVWSASSDDAFGLFVEAETLDDLIERLVVVFVDLQQCKGSVPDSVLFKVSCTNPEKTFQHCSFNLETTPQQALAV